MAAKEAILITLFSTLLTTRELTHKASYPYTPKDGECKFNKKTIGATIASFNDIEPGSEDALQKAVAEIGPISTYIDTFQDSFLLYKGGVYDEPKCNSLKLNQAVLVVGYGSLKGQDYWIVKNSWPKSWGDKGYILMSRNKNNQCGIASAASYPVL